MVTSIIDDIKQSFRSGNMVTRIIIINIAIYMVTALMEAFAPSFYHSTIIKWLAMPGAPIQLLYKPWTIITSLFVHAGLGHVIWNMLIFYWFGRIVGDLIGDRHILPIYLVGGIVGNIAFMISSVLYPHIIGSYAIGASAAVMATAIIAGLINPDHEIRLLFLGIIKIKFIILAIVFFDLLGIGKQDNTGGHIAHLGGMMMGWFYMLQLGKGNDIANLINSWIGQIGNLFDKKREQKKFSRSHMTVSFKSDKVKSKTQQHTNIEQEEIDDILDKIKKDGYGNLSDIDKEILFKASKK
ncbi:MAG: rhomboid family intramembrane serine protease [Saprospiraceae bacterium]